MSGHLYCSPKCARDGGRKEMRIRIRRRLARPVSARLAVAAVLAACFAPTVLALRAVSELDRLNAPAPFAPAPRPALVRIERIVPGPQGAAIEGRGPEGGAVFLFSGSRFVATAYVEQGRFRFEGVGAAGPYRVGAIPLASAPAPEPERAAADPPPAAASPLAPTPAAPSSAPRAASSAPAPPSPGHDRLSDTHPLAVASAAPPRPFVERGLAVPDVSRGPRDRPEVLVSFDAGSSDRGALQILDALRERRIRTTIFLTGVFIRRYPDIARRIAADGHEVGNHTDTHPHLTTYAENGRQATRPGVDRAFLEKELAATARIWDATTGRSMAARLARAVRRAERGDSPLGGGSRLLARRLDRRPRGPGRSRLGFGSAVSRLSHVGPRRGFSRGAGGKRRHRAPAPGQRPGGSRRVPDLPPLRRPRRTGIPIRARIRIPGARGADR